MDKKNPLINEFLIQLMIYVLFYTDIFHLLNLHQLSEEDIPLQDYEIKHIEIMRRNVAECALFLKKDLSFPLKSPGKVVLVGAGARGTTKGGTGSGDVESRYFSTCEEGLENAGFEIVSKDWLTKYPIYHLTANKEKANLNFLLILKLFFCQ